MPKTKWTAENLKIGFEKFASKHQRLPTANEIDRLNYLPSARQIQRRFGGLENLRKTLGYSETHFGKGVYRSKYMIGLLNRARNEEAALETLLQQKFGEIFVHREKPFAGVRVDFFVYTINGNFGVDIFYTDLFINVQKIINIKIQTYKYFSSDLYYVAVGNKKEYGQEELDEYANFRKNERRMPPNHHIVTLEKFLEVIGSKIPYPDPRKQF